MTETTNTLVIDGKVYRVALVGENARSEETMREMVKTIINSRQAVGTTNEDAKNRELATQLKHFIDIFEVVGVQ